MKKFYLAIAIITLVLIIAAGCGGSGDGITTPSSITNQTETTSSNIATIIIKVQWPERGEPGSYKILSSNEEDTLIASDIPDGTKRIDVKVMEYANRDNIIGEASIPRDDDEAEIKIPIPPNTDPETPNILPVVRVLIRAEAWDSESGGTMLAEVENDKELVVGANTVDLDLQGTVFTVTLQLTPNKFHYIPDFQSEVFKTVEEITVTANFKQSPPSATPTPVANGQVRFKITSENAFFVDGSGTPTAETEVPTDPNGNCPATIKLDVTAVDKFSTGVVVNARCWTSGLDPNTDAFVAERNIRIPINYPLIVKQNFEDPNWAVDTDLYNLLSLPWSVHYAAPRPDNLATVYSPGANNTDKCAQLFAEPTVTQWQKPTDGITYCQMGYQFSNPIPSNVELRFYIKNANDELGYNQFILPGTRYRGRVNFVYFDILKFKDTNELVGLNGFSLMSYSLDEWYKIKIQILTKATKEFHYWINDIDYGVTTPGPNSVLSEYFLNVFTHGGKVWYDEFQVYDLNTLPPK